MALFSTWVLFVCWFVCLFPKEPSYLSENPGFFFWGEWLCQVLLTLHGLSLAAVQGLFIVMASRCGARALGMQASGVVVHGL